MNTNKIIFALHNHSEGSLDSESKIKDIIKTCEAQNIDLIAITDHDNFFDMEKIKDIKTNVKVIPGIEISTIDDSHIIGLFITKKIKKRQDMISTIKDIHKQGGIAILPHPFRKWQGYLSPRYNRTNEEIEAVLDAIDGVEIYNAKSNPIENKAASTFFRLRDIAPFVGSDAHVIENINSCLTILFPEDLIDIKEILLSSRRSFKINKWEQFKSINSFYIRKIAKWILSLFGLRENDETYQKIRGKFLK